MPAPVYQTLDDPRVVERIKVLDQYCFPVRYSPDYYNNIGKLVKGDATHTWTALNSVAFYQEMLVGSVTTRLEARLEDDGKTPAADGKLRAYIMTLGVLEPYRRMGIASTLVRRVIDCAASMSDVLEIGLHVQQGSTALAFYQKLGFEVRYEVKNYYTDIEPTLDAFYVSIKSVKTK